MAVATAIPIAALPLVLQGVLMCSLHVAAASDAALAAAIVATLDVALKCSAPRGDAKPILRRTEPSFCLSTFAT